MKQPWIPALIFSLIILGCFLLGALIDKYFRMKAMREFARRWKEAEKEPVARQFIYQNFYPSDPSGTQFEKYLFEECQRSFQDGHGNDVTHIANGEAP